MFYIKKDQENLDALNLINEVIQAHFKEKAEKEAELLNCYTQSENINSQEFQDLIFSHEEELKSIEWKIAGIVYARDYLRFKLKQANKL